MEKTKVTLIYWGLSLFVFLALIPWIFDITIALYSIQALAIYGGTVVAFLGGYYLGLGRSFSLIKKPLGSYWVFFNGSRSIFGNFY
jgi:hypothetical protein